MLLLLLLLLLPPLLLLMLLLLLLMMMRIVMMVIERMFCFPAEEVLDKQRKSVSQTTCKTLVLLFPDLILSGSCEVKRKTSLKSFPLISLGTQNVTD